MTRYAVVGPGGVGGLLAVLLGDAGHDVVVVARAKSVKALQERGFHLYSPVFGERASRPDVVERLDRSVDAVLLAVKATALPGALDGVPADVVGDALVVPFLNGVDHMHGLRERYSSVVAGVIRVESSRSVPGVIEHGSDFARIQLAAHGEMGERARRVVDDLAGAGLEAELRPDEPATLWSKLAFLAPFALLTTAHRAPVGGVRTEHAVEMGEVIREVAAVACAEGGPCDPEPTVAAFLAFGPETKSSMLRDAEAGQPLELDAIGGAVLRAARAHGIPVPRTEALVRQLGGS